MIYIFLCSISAVTLVMVLKLLKRYQINNFEAIVINYIFCVLVGLLILPNKNIFFTTSFWQQTWIPFTCLLGTLFLIGFFAMANATQKIGIAVATIANKSSMILPVTVAFFLYNDKPTPLKIMGLVTALIAVILTAYKPINAQLSNKNARWQQFLFPLWILINSGCIEITTNYVQHYYLPKTNVAAFPILSFAMAGVISGVILLINYKKHPNFFTLKTWIAGAMLGLPNFLAFYFFLLALENSGLSPTALFPINNLSIVLLSTLASVLFFNEKLYPINWFGIFLSATAIIMVACGTMFTF